MNTRLCIRSILLATSLAAAPLGVVPLAGSADLGSIYQQALKNDPIIREAEANRLAARESKPQALSALLPQVTAGGRYDDSSSDGTSTFIAPGFPTGSERRPAAYSPGLRRPRPPSTAHQWMKYTSTRSARLTPSLTSWERPSAWN